MGIEKSLSSDPLIQITEIDSGPWPLAPKSTFASSWRVTVSCGAVLTAATLVVNITVLAWGKSLSKEDGDAVTIFEGSCETSQNTTLWLHFAINILSTLLLGVSNNCAQLLSSPTRSEIDKAHLRGTWLEVGVPGIRNLRWISVGRRIMWFLLLASSFPLHLLYNSAIYSATAANTYQIALVTTDFLHGGWWNATVAAKNVGEDDPGKFWGPVSEHEKAIEPTRVLQNNVEKLVRLENSECIQAYTTKFQSNWGDVLVVSSVERNSSVIQIWNYDPAPNIMSTDLPGYDGQDWVCNGRVNFRFGDAVECDVHALTQNPASWKIEHVAQCKNPGDGSCDSFDAAIDYCLATRTPSHCSVQMSPSVLYVVTACNIVKIVCLLSTIFLLDFEPIATVGDAIGSFIRQPDSATSHSGLLSSKLGGVECRTRIRRWRSAVGTSRALLCLFTAVGLWVVALILFFVAFVSLETGSTGYRVPSWTELSKTEFGGLHLSYAIGKTTHHSLMTNIILANLPQLGVSLVYVLYNNVFTYMVSAHEYTKFATTRKPLRVSRPHGQQRTTFWLQLPYRYALPLLSSMAILHWLISRSLFMFQLTIYGDNGTRVVDQKAWYPWYQLSTSSHPSVLACGYSPVAIICALVFGAAMIFALIGLSFRKLSPGMPITASNSLAISAAASTACHEPDAALLPLKYGALPANWSRRDVQRVGLSSKEVDPIIYCYYEVIGKCARMLDRDYWIT